MRTLIILFVLGIFSIVSLFAARGPLRERRAGEDETTTATGNTSSSTEQTDSTRVLSSNSVTTYFRDMNSQTTLAPDNSNLTDQEKEVLNWILAHVQIASNKNYKFVLTKTRLGSSDADILERHHQKKYPALIGDKDYIALQYIRQSMATEYQGVIEIEPLRILSYWKELR